MAASVTLLILIAAGQPTVLKKRERAMNQNLGACMHKHSSHMRSVATIEGIKRIKECNRLD